MHWDPKKTALGQKGFSLPLGLQTTFTSFAAPECPSCPIFSSLPSETLFPGADRVLGRDFHLSPLFLSSSSTYYLPLSPRENPAHPCARSNHPS